MSEIVEIRNTDDPRDVIHRAVELLTQGNLVVFPTETVYAVAALAINADGVRKLLELVGSLNESPAECALGVKGVEEATDYFPAISPLGARLARRCWPGPVTLELIASGDAGLLAALPEETRKIIAPDGGVRMRSPAHDVILEALRLLPAPLLLSPESPAVMLDQLDPQAADNAALIIGDGACRYGQPSTVVRVENDRWKIVREGVVTDTMISRLTSNVYLFVCTGNTCRSPLAEGLFRKMLCESLQCTEEELYDRGFVVESAGLSAALGTPVAPESAEVAARYGVDLRGHTSQPLTDRLLQQADIVYTMTRSHQESILAARPDLADRVRLFRTDGGDIPDPIGGSIEDYEACCREIETQLQKILAGIRKQ